MSILSKLRCITVDVTGTLIAYKGELGDYYCMAAKAVGLPCPDYKRMHEGFKAAYSDMARRYPCFGHAAKIPNIDWWRSCVKDSFVRVRIMFWDMYVYVRTLFRCIFLHAAYEWLQSIAVLWITNTYIFCMCFGNWLCCRPAMNTMRRHSRRYSDVYIRLSVPRPRTRYFPMRSPSWDGCGRRVSLSELLATPNTVIKMLFFLLWVWIRLPIISSRFILNLDSSFRWRNKLSCDKLFRSGI